MGIFDKLKKNKSTAPKPSDQPVAVEETAPAAESDTQVIKRHTGDAYQVLVRPILSEKGTHLAGKGEYVFAVSGRANKSEIRKSIQKVYEVHVTGVKIINLPGKKRKYGKTQGQTSDWKKAIVKVKAGEKIPGIIEAVG